MHHTYTMCIQQVYMYSVCGQYIETHKCANTHNTQLQWTHKPAERHTIQSENLPVGVRKKQGVTTLSRH